MGIHLSVAHVTSNTVPVTEIDFEVGDACPDFSSMSPMFAAAARKSWKPARFPRLEVSYNTLPADVLDKLEPGETYDVKLHIRSDVQNRIVDGHDLKFEGITPADPRFQRSQARLTFSGTEYGQILERVT